MADESETVTEMSTRNKEEMQRVSGTLNRDAFAHQMLAEQIEMQEESEAQWVRSAEELEGQAERARAKAATARERAASLRDTLSRLETPRG